MSAEWYVVEGTQQILRRTHIGTLNERCRPVVVLDLSQWSSASTAAVCEWLRAKCVSAPSESQVHYIANAIEAQTKPPKPDEPLGLGAVVEDAEAWRWVLFNPGGRKPWRRNEPRSYDGATYRIYADIDAVKVLTEGIR